MNIEEFMKKNKLTEDFLVYCVSTGLRQLQEDELEPEELEERLERFNIQDEDEIEELITEVDALSWETTGK